MMYKLTLFIFVNLGVNLSAQNLGINTTAPQTTLDIELSDPTAITNGLSVPQVNTIPPTANREGQIVYFTAQNEFYYASGTTWIPFFSQQNIGSVKNSFKTTDHNGWFLMDGRALNTLTATQQQNASNIGITGALPDANNGHFTQNTNGPLGSTSGDNTIDLTLNNLPNITYTSTTNAVTHNHRYSIPFTNNVTSQLPGAFRAVTVNTNFGNGPIGFSAAGAHTHNYTVTLGNSTPITFEDNYLQINKFVYLGTL